MLCTGDNGLGQLGIPKNPNQINPNVDTFTLCTNFDNKQGKIKAISCGNNHTALLTIFGYIYCTGYNNFGQLGIPKQYPYYVDTFTLCTDIDKIQ